jgi:hypothetical protein
MKSEGMYLDFNIDIEWMENFFNMFAYNEHDWMDDII